MKDKRIQVAFFSSEADGKPPYKMSKLSECEKGYRRWISPGKVNNRNKLLEQHLWVLYLMEIEAIYHDACDCKSCERIRADFPAWKEQRKQDEERHL